MKNLIAALLVLISFNSFSQTSIVDMMLGTWQSDQTTMILTISQAEDEISFSNWDSLDGAVYDETIINLTKNKINTILHIPETNWNLNINYYVENNILISNCTGSYNGNISYYRILN